MTEIALGPQKSLVYQRMSTVEKLSRFYFAINTAIECRTHVFDGELSFRLNYEDVNGRQNCHLTEDERNQISSTYIKQGWDSMSITPILVNNKDIQFEVVLNSELLK